MDKRYRSAVTGQFVSEDEAINNPRETVGEQVVQAEEEGNLVKHAKIELGRLDIEPELKASLVAAIKGFTTYAHSGGLVGWAIETLTRLLSFENLASLNSIAEDPTEWINHSDKPELPVWQNRRNSKVFSDDGLTYYWVEDPQRLKFNDPNEAIPE